jgi:arylsulfatase A-like enzyme
VCDELTGTIDVLPTIAALTGKSLPSDRKIDGIDVSGLWKGTLNRSPRTEFIHYTSVGNLEGLRQGDWKILVKKPRNQNNQQGGPNPTQIMLFNLRDDVGEQNNLASQYPDLVRILTQRMEALDQEITTNARAPWVTE